MPYDTLQVSRSEIKSPSAPTAPCVLLPKPVCRTVNALDGMFQKHNAMN
ncbi:MAG: hypothetical protein SNJ66_13340 [Chloroherpetonaceae bacterium]